jgi:hypothetical protein
LRAIEGGFSYQTDSVRALETIMLLSLLQLLNILTVLEEGLKKGVVAFVYVILISINTVIFYRRDMYKIIVADENNMQSYMYWISGFYLTLTLALFNLKFW